MRRIPYGLGIALNVDAVYLDAWQEGNYIDALVNFSYGNYWEPSRPSAYGINSAVLDGSNIANPARPVSGTSAVRGAPIEIKQNTSTTDRGGRDKHTQAAPVDGMTMGYDWFEKMHVQPLSFDFGNVVSDITTEIVLYNAYRKDSRLFTAFTNNVGDGVTVTDLPTLPKTIINQFSVTLTLSVTTEGPPNIDGTLDFTFDIGSAEVEVTGTRIILFPYLPQNNVREFLSWLTSITTADVGTEARISLRQYPRKAIDMEFIHVDEKERRRFNALIYRWQSKIFGVPLWWDARKVIAQSTSPNNSIELINISYADFRVGGLTMLWERDPITGEVTAEALEVAALYTPTSSPNIFPNTGHGIVFTAPINNVYTTAAVAVPVLPCITGDAVETQSFPSATQESRLRFQSVDSQTAVTEDTTAFDSTLNEILIDDQNFQDVLLEENYNVQLTVIDGDTGEVTQLTEQDTSTKTTRKKWIIETAQKEWEVRQLLYALRGQQQSFLLPTYRTDMVAVGNASAGGTTLDIENIGFSLYYQGSPPFNRIRVLFKPPGVAGPGSPSIPGDFLELTNTVTGATEVDADTETITVSAGWDAAFQPSDIERIEFLVLSRLDSDTVVITHNWNDILGNDRDSEIDVPIRGILDV